MSLYGDFQTAWSRRFPGCVLPQAWEDDVRQNLQKHRQRVAVLKEELEKEAFYVEYLERLLADVERHKRPPGDGLTTPEPLSPPQHGGCEDDGDDHNKLPETLVATPPEVTNVASVASDDIPSPADDTERSDDQRDSPPDESSPEGRTGSAGRGSVKQFITVIEVNGYGRRSVVGPPTPTSPGRSESSPLEVAPDGTGEVGPVVVVEEEQQHQPEEEEDDDASHSSSLPGSQDSAGSSPAVRKKVPPKPPPKRTNNWPPRSGSERGAARPVLPVPTVQRTEERVTEEVSGRPSDGPVISATAVGRRLAGLPPTKPRPPVRASTKSNERHSPSSIHRPLPQTPPPDAGDVATAVGEVAEMVTGVVPPEELEEDEVVWPVPEESWAAADYPTLSSDRSSDYDAHTLRSQASTCSRSGLSDSTSGGGGLDEGEEGDGSPKYADYVNINYFLRRRARLKHRSLTRGESGAGAESDDDEDDEEERDDDLDEAEVEADVASLEPVGILLQALRHDSQTETATATAGQQGRTMATDDALDADSGVYSSSVESTSFLGTTSSSSSSPPTLPLPPTKVRQLASIRDEQETAKAAAAAAVVAVEVVADSVEAERITMIRCIINSILESETIYWECLNVLIQYTKALRSTIGTSQPVISQEDLNIIFHKIPELHAIHHAFLEGVRNRVKTWDEKLIVGDHFKILASRLGVYASFLQNYPRAIETVRKCSAENVKFSDITKSIKLQALKGQAASLEDLLHKPVARVQKNALVLHDLLKYTPASHPDHKALQVALRMTQCFLNEFNMSATESMFPAHDRTQRHLVKNSFIVELSEGHRKLRHLFLFNDVIVCAKYKATGRDKFAYEVKWYIPLHDAVIPTDEVDEKEVREVSTVSILSLKSQVTIVRDQIMREEQVGRERAGRASGRVIDKHRKKLAELQAQLMLASPHLVFRVGQKGGKTFIFFLSSKFERAQWIEAVTAVQSSAPPTAANLTLYEIQAWITACHKFLQTNMGSFLLRSGKEDDMLVGDLHVVANGVQGFTKPADVFLLFEIDCYGHFFGKAKTKVYPNSVDPRWDQEFIIELEGSQMLRILCYQQIPNEAPVLRGKATIELNKSWLTNRMQEKKISLQELTLSLSLKFTHSEMSLRRVPSSKPCGVFGLKLSHVMKKEKRTIPFLITCCVREVEKRGMHELGIYRVSGSASDMHKLKRAFESNPYEAEQLLKEVDIHSVTCILKLYLRELPEGLFTDELYPKFIEAFKMSDGEPKTTTLLNLYASLPAANLDIITYLVEHMVKVIKEESQNKMSLQNIATVFGPTLLRPSAKLDGVLTGDKLAAGTIDVMAQATVLFFFLKRRVSGEPLLAPNHPSAQPSLTRNSVPAD